MSTPDTRHYLVRLHKTILEERVCAKALDMDGLIRVMNEKEAIMQLLAEIRTIDEEDKPIATMIREENLRNAYLFKSTLSWIRETMEFLGQKTLSSTYSPGASTIHSQVNGRLLSGKI